jgi:hypothetical protein
MSRRALLLAIAEYDPLPVIPYVENDNSRLRSALLRAGYRSEHIIIEGAGAGRQRTRELTTSRLRSSICDFLDDAKNNDEILIYFSGHGIELDGRRVLLPQDFSPKHSDADGGMVTEAFIATYARGSKARSVVILIDACRESTHYELVPGKTALRLATDDGRHTSENFQVSDSPTITILYSCDTGEQSARDRHGEDCSAFTRAFSEVVELEQGPSDLEKICAETRRRLTIYSHGRQSLAVSGFFGRHGPWEKLVIKEDEAARFRERLSQSEWVRILEDSGLFKKVAASLPSFATQLRALAVRAEQHFHEANQQLPMQRWRDAIVWQRQAARTYHVFLSGNDDETVPAVEAAVLLAVPFVYETVLAVAEARLAASGALPDPEAARTFDYLTSAWLNAWRNSDVAVMRRALLSQSKLEAADDFSCWSLVHFCHASGEMWDAQGGREGRTGWVFDAISALVAPAPLSEVMDDHRVCEVLSAARLLRFARLMFASFDDVTLDTAGNNRLLDAEVSTGEFDTQLVLNEVRLAHILNMASQLALDPRRMPPLLGEHVGIDVVLSARWIGSQLSRAEWHGRSPLEASSRAGARRWFDLKLDCPNDALDAALLEVVNSLEGYRTRLLQRQDIHFEAVHNILPAGFTANRLNAAPSGWRPVRPPLRFELDRSRIISLLMGHQLYGESWPALREVYQNALDACRYRRAMEDLSTHDGTSPGRNYRGAILLRFGCDEGRRFVECVDNGIGMADHHIRRLFAYAGRRFTDSHEFHIDRARWDEAGIKFYSNSRFGVGVLSYFMLAEELDIATHRWVPPVHPGFVPVRARVLGTGSLFRTEASIDPSRLIDSYGTAVRLFLREDAPNDDSLLQTIISWLCVPEVAVAIKMESGQNFEFTEGQPTPAFISAMGNVLLPVRGSEDSHGAPRLYLAPCFEESSDYRKDQVVLVDGIATLLFGRPWGRELIVNLKEELRSTLTVDRRRVELTRLEAKPVHRWLGQAGGAALASWGEPGFIKLHRTLRGLPSEVTISADLAFRSLREPVTVTVPKLNIVWPLSSAGISDVDTEIALELLNASRRNAMAEVRSYPERTEFTELEGLLLNSGGATHAVASKVLAARLIDLSEAGLDTPAALLRAALFDTRDCQRFYPTGCAPILTSLNRSGRIGVSDVLLWIERGCTVVVDTAREMAKRWPNIVSFDFDRLGYIDPMCRRLLKLAGSDSLSWLALAYFGASENIKIDAVLELARSVAQYGVEVPDLCSPPSGISLDSQEYEFLRQSLLELQNIARYDFAGLQYGIGTFIGPDYEKNHRMEEEFVRRKLISDFFQRGVDPEILTRDQRLLASIGREGEPPFRRSLFLRDIFEFWHHRKLKSLRELAVEAYSLEDLGFDVNLGNLLNVDGKTLDRFEELNLGEYGSFIMVRLFSAVNENWAISIWDLGLLAAAERIDPARLLPLIDLLESAGGDVAYCREFLRFCG